MQNASPLPQRSRTSAVASPLPFEQAPGNAAARASRPRPKEVRRDDGSFGMGIGVGVLRREWRACGDTACGDTADGSDACESDTVDHLDAVDADRLTGRAVEH